MVRGGRVEVDAAEVVAAPGRGRKEPEAEDGEPEMEVGIEPLDACIWPYWGGVCCAAFIVPGCCCDVRCEIECVWVGVETNGVPSECDNSSSSLREIDVFEAEIEVPS